MEDKIELINGLYSETFEDPGFEDGFQYCLDKVLEILEKTL